MQNLPDFNIDKAKFEAKVENLTRTKKQVLELFLKGLDDGAIAAEITVAEGTIRQHIKNIADNFGIASDRTDKGFRRREIVRLFWTFAPERVAVPHYCDEAWESSSHKLATPPITNALSITPVISTREFNLLGRDGDRQKLEEFSQKSQIVLIKAGAGVGKSTLAREFLQSKFQKVIRLEMGWESSNVTPAEEKVAQILRRDFDEEPSRDFGINLDILRSNLSDPNQPIAVLIDNLEPALDANFRFSERLRGYEALFGVLGDRDVCSFTLITSRRSLIVPRAKVNEYSLQGLDITAWRQYFNDYENVETSESLLQMRDAYNGNAKVMDILHGAVKKHFDGTITAYWNGYKDALLANKEIETLIYAEINWLRDNQPNTYKLFYQIDLHPSPDKDMISFNGLLELSDTILESSKIAVIDSLLRTSLIEIKGENKYYLSPVFCQAAKSHLWENISVFGESNLSLGNELNTGMDMYELDRRENIKSSIRMEIQDVYGNFENFSQDSINKSFTQENHFIKSSNLVDESTQVSSVFRSVFPTFKDSAINTEFPEILGIGLPTNDTLLDLKQAIISPTIINNQNGLDENFRK